MSPDEIKKYCYLTRTFGLKVKLLKDKFPDSTFKSALIESLEQLTEVSKNPSTFVHSKSGTYLNYYMNSNPAIDLKGNNPFCVLSFSKTLSIDLIYVLYDEVKASGISEVLLRTGEDNPSSDVKVCLFDLFDGFEPDFPPIKPVNIKT